MESLMVVVPGEGAYVIRQCLAILAWVIFSSAIGPGLGWILYLFLEGRSNDAKDGLRVILVIAVLTLVMGIVIQPFHSIL